ncbi:MAG: discoidin domain-containing protein, partial [Gemmatimonadota bacterium]
LEFKLADSTGENVWWYTERDRAFDGQWHQIIVRRRQIAFAWGPAGGGELHRAASLEIVMTAGTGGRRGTIWVDDLRIAPLPAVHPYDQTPVAAADGSETGFGPELLMDHDTSTAWRSRAGVTDATVTIDFVSQREFGGLSLRWEPGRRARSYEVALSADGKAWRIAHQVRAGDGPRDAIYLPDAEARYLRLTLHQAEGPGGFGLTDLMIQPLAFGASRNAFFAAVAADEPVGTYPRYWAGQRAWWTVVGLDRAREEALVSEDAALEPGAGAFSIEPFIREGQAFDSWHDGHTTVGLTDSTLPLPWVTREARGLRLTLTAFAAGSTERSSIIAQYRITNLTDSVRSPTLYLSVRPFQVNPPSQFLNRVGGYTPIDSMHWTGSAMTINGTRQVVPFTPPAWVAVQPFAAGDIVSRIRSGRLGGGQAAVDPSGAASGAMGWPLTLKPGDSTDIAIEIPLTPRGVATVAPGSLTKVGRALDAARAAWHGALERTTIDLPPSGAALSQSITTTLGYILINRDGPAIQPGSRSYERSWIRDGALTSAALLRFGHADAVRQFIVWYAGYQASSGRVPCCVDARGADPVPEHDSHGEFIYLVMEYWRHTGDRTLLTSMWPHVRLAAAYIDSLRRSERTPAYQQGSQQLFFGLLPASISHEGYSAKAQHSYWDDFFALRGLTDAATMAAVLGDSADALRLGTSRDEFRTDLLQSITRSMAAHQIDYIPGSADLGDFDATSTTIALNPVEAEGWLPDAALRNTFDKYWHETETRIDSSREWDAYTPYELRTVGALLRLGQTERAWALLDSFLADQEPPAWHQWPEIVYHDPRALRFIGDLPHTWVGSDFLRSAADLFAWERERDSALVVGQGIKPEWLDGVGVTVNQLHTWWGTLSYKARRQGLGILLTIDAGVNVPAGGIVIGLPGIAGRAIQVDGTDLPPGPEGQYRIHHLPARITIQ